MNWHSQPSWYTHHNGERICSFICSQAAGRLQEEEEECVYRDVCEEFHRGQGAREKEGEEDGSEAHAR